MEKNKSIKSSRDRKRLQRILATRPQSARLIAGALDPGFLRLQQHAFKDWDRPEAEMAFRSL